MFNRIRIDLINDFIFENIDTVADFKAGKRNHPALLYQK